MNWIYNLISILVIWSAIGLIPLGALFGITQNQRGALGQAKGWEFVNPLHIYKHNHVNWFGASMVALWYSLLCPVGALCYWVYKIIYTLCTMGRK